MTRLRALNESSSEDGEEESEERETIEAQEERAFTLYKRALELRQLGRYADAEQLLISLLNEDFLANVSLEDNTVATDGLARPSAALKYACLKNLGNILVLQEKANEGLKCYIKAVELDESDVTIWHQMGTVALQIDDFYLACRAFQEGLRCNSRHWPCLDSLLPLLYSLNDYLGCLLLVSQALELDPEYPLALALRAQILKEDPKLLENFKHFYPDAFDITVMPSDLSEEDIKYFISHALSLQERYRIKSTTQPDTSVEKGSVLLTIPLQLSSWEELGKCLMHSYKSIILSSDKSYLHPVEIGSPDSSMSNENERHNDMKQSSEAHEKIIESNTISSVVVEAENEPMDVDSEQDAKGEDQTEEEQTEASGLELEEEVKITSVVQQSNASWKKKRKKSTFTLMDQWSKRRSGRRSGRKVEDREECNLASCFRSLLPDSLLPKDLEAEIARASRRRSLRDPVELLVCDDSLDAVELCRLLQERDAKDEHQRKVQKKSKDNFAQRIHQENYFGSEREVSDVSALVKKCGCGDHNIIELLIEFVSMLSTKSYLTWPPGLVPIYIDTYRSMRTHVPWPSPFDSHSCSQISMTDLCASLLYCELVTDVWQQRSQNDLTELDTLSDCTLILGEALGNVTLLSGLAHIFPSFCEQYKFTLRMHWVKAHLSLLKDDSSSAISSLHDVLQSFDAVTNMKLTECKIKNKSDCVMSSPDQSKIEPSEVGLTSKVTSLSETTQLCRNGSGGPLALTQSSEQMESADRNGCNSSTEINLSPAVDTQNICVQGNSAASGKVAWEMATDKQEDIIVECLPVVQAIEGVVSNAKENKEKIYEEAVNGSTDVEMIELSLQGDTTAHGEDAVQNTHQASDPQKINNVATAENVKELVLAQNRDNAEPTAPLFCQVKREIETDMVEEESSTKFTNLDFVRMKSNKHPAVKESEHKEDPNEMAKLELLPGCGNSNNLELTIKKVSQENLPHDNGNRNPVIIEEGSERNMKSESLTEQSMIETSICVETESTTSSSKFLVNPEIPSALVVSENEALSSDRKGSEEDEPSLDQCSAVSKLNCEVFLPNCRMNQEIKRKTAQKLLMSLTRHQQLSEVDELYTSAQYDILSRTLTECFKYCAQQADCENRELDNLPDRPTQMAMLLDSLWQLQKYNDCFYWAEACLHEAFNRYLSSLDSDSSLQDHEDSQMWATTVERLLAGLNGCLKAADLTLWKVPKACLTRLVQTLISMLCQQLEQNDSSVEMAIECTTPWVILHRVIYFEEQQVPISQDTIPSYMSVLFTAHEYMAKKARCCLNEGILLYLILDVVVPKIRSTDLSGARATLNHEVEQAILCLYGHPKKTTERSKKRLQDHKAHQQLELTWERSLTLLRFYEPDELPAFDSTAKVSPEDEQLFLRILQLVPSDINPSKCRSKVKAFLSGSVDTLPDLDCSFPEAASNLYYLLADYYMKTLKWDAAVKYYLLDICLNPYRFDSWAGMALAKATRLTLDINSCDTFDNDLQLRRKNEALVCFQMAVELDPENTTMWVEFGNFAYTVHSFCSRLLKTETDSLSMEMFTKVNEEKDKMLSITERCFKAAELLDQDERWLQQYMLGKVAEKRGEGPAVFLQHYRLAAQLLYESKAVYPLTLNYDPPQHYAFEAHEIHYRIHASILKDLESKEGKYLTEDMEILYKQTLEEAGEGPFMAVRKASQLAMNAKRASVDPVENLAKKIKADEQPSVLNISDEGKTNSLIPAISTHQSNTGQVFNDTLSIQENVAAITKTRDDIDILSLPQMEATSNIIETSNSRTMKDVSGVKIDEGQGSSSNNGTNKLCPIESDVTVIDSGAVAFNTNQSANIEDQGDKVVSVKDCEIPSVSPNQSDSGKSKISSPYVVSLGPQIQLRPPNNNINLMTCNFVGVVDSCGVGVDCMDGVDLSRDKPVHGTVSVVAEHDYAAPCTDVASKPTQLSSHKSSNENCEGCVKSHSGSLSPHPQQEWFPPQTNVIFSEKQSISSSFESSSFVLLGGQIEKENMSTNKMVDSNCEDGNSELNGGKLGHAISSMRKKAQPVPCNLREENFPSKMMVCDGSSIKGCVRFSTISSEEIKADEVFLTKNQKSNESNNACEKFASVDPSHTSESAGKDLEKDDSSHLNQELVEEPSKMGAPQMRTELGRETTASGKSSDHLDLINQCLVGIEECLVRYPRHYKSFYRLCHYYYRSKHQRNLRKCRQLFLGDYRVMRVNKNIGGLFKSVNINSMFNDVWRMPIDEIDRAGSFASHMSRCVHLLVDILRAQRDHATLLKLSLFLKRDPEKKDKKYLRDNERADLSKQALLMCLAAMRDSVNETRVVDHLIELYRTIKDGIKEMPQKEGTFKALLSDSYKKLKGLNQGDQSFYENAVELCQNELSIRKASSDAKIMAQAQAQAQFQLQVQAVQAAQAQIGTQIGVNPITPTLPFNTLAPRFSPAVSTPLVANPLATPIFLSQVPGYRGRGRPPKAQQRLHNAMMSMAQMIGLANTASLGSTDLSAPKMKQQQKQCRAQQLPVSTPSPVMSSIIKDRPSLSITTLSNSGATTTSTAASNSASGSPIPLPTLPLPSVSSAQGAWQPRPRHSYPKPMPDPRSILSSGAPKPKLTSRAFTASSAPRNFHQQQSRPFVSSQPSNVPLEDPTALLSRLPGLQIKQKVTSLPATAHQQQGLGMFLEQQNKVNKTKDIARQQLQSMARFQKLCMSSAQTQPSKPAISISKIPAAAPPSSSHLGQGSGKVDGPQKGDPNFDIITLD